MRGHPHRAVVALAALTLGIAVPAAAQFTVINNTGSATVATSYTPASFLPAQTVTTTFGPNGGAAIADLDYRQFGRLRSVQLGIGLNAVAVDATLQDLPFFDWTARTEYDLEVQDAGAAGNSLDFQYHLNGGQLELQDPGELFSGMLSRVSVSIFAVSPGFSGFLWAWTLSMHSDLQGNVSSSVDFLIDPLGFGVPALSPITIANGRAAMTIGSFTAGTNLGVLSGGQTAFVTYDMDAVVNGPGFGSGGLARLGDPFDTNGNYGAGITLSAAPTTVPEPGTLWLVAGGLVVMGAVKRRLSS